MTQYYDPKEEPGGEKKMLLAFLLVFVAIAVMQYLAPKPAPPAQPKPGPQQQTLTPAPPPPAESGPQPRAADVAMKQAEGESETIVENSLYRIVFSNRGAVVKSWFLKKYKNEKHNELDLVNVYTAPVLGYPLSLFSYDSNLQKKVNEALYVPSAVGVQSAPTAISFEYSDGQTTVRKHFTFDPNSYVVGVETQVTDGGRTVQAFPQWPGGFGDQIAIPYYGHSELVWNQDGKVTRKQPTSGFFLTGKSWVVGGQTLNGPFNWVATVDSYFTAVFIPEAPSQAALVTLHTLVDIPKTADKSDDKAPAQVLGAAVGSANGSTRERIFVGPKDVDILEAVRAQPNGVNLGNVLDFGWFGVIARPLFLWLKWTFYHWIPNWGWAIAFLTIVINGVLFPLRLSSMKSQLKMQKIQPQIKVITEKYKKFGMTDPRRAQMQEEMSALYKREGVNPVGGCFPMLLQLPFLYAFYAVLGNAIELRQAGWLWVHDLSSADPIHVLPVVIVISMFLSSKTMPQGGIDPAQQRMMQVITPLMLGAISWGLPAGLGVYWVISNLLMWVQQLAINQTEFGKQVRKSVERRAARKR